MADATVAGPEPAWRRRADWVKGEVEEEGGRELGASAAAAALVWALATGSGFAGWFGDGFFWLFALLLGAVGIFLVGRLLRQLLRHRKFGRSVLHLNQTPARAGERLAGRVRSGIPRTEPVPTFRVQLRCIRRWKTESGVGEDKTTEHHTEVLWNDGQATKGELQASAGGAVAFAVPVAFDLPEGARATTAIGRWEGIAWELKLSAELPGLDYGATFELPVLTKVED